MHGSIHDVSAMQDMITNAVLLCPGYQYGRIPWADADVTVLVDEKGVSRFCLQELCSKVLASTDLQLVATF